jgi:tetratricopeptide (TPR) repeat protein
MEESTVVHDAETKSAGNPNMTAGTDSTTSTGTDPDSDADNSVCSSCGQSPVIEGYSIPLCQECRQHFTRFPIPKWIKAFAVVILFFLIYSLVSFPKSLNAGVAYERGLRAEGEKKYMTAAREYEKASEIFPDSFIINGKLFVASVKNNQFGLAEEAFARIEGKESSDSKEIEVIDQANDAMIHLDLYYSISESLIDLFNQYAQSELDDLAEKLSEYIVQNPSEHWAYYYYASILFDLEKYDEAKTAYLKALNMQPDIYEFKLGAAAAYRQTGEFDKAISECNSVLAENAEYVDAYASLCKVHLKQHHYDEALQSATTAYSLDNNSDHAVYTLALAYHFNGMISERDTSMTLLKETVSEYYQAVKDIIDGKSRLYD